MMRGQHARTYLICLFETLIENETIRKALHEHGAVETAHKGVEDRGTASYYHYISLVSGMDDEIFFECILPLISYGKLEDSLR